MKRLAALLLPLAFAGCATTGGKGDQVFDTACNIARAELSRCDTGAELDARRCRAAADAVFVCSIGGRTPEDALVASNLRPGVGLVPRLTQVCWREFVGGPAKSGTGRLDVDPWTVAGMPGGGQGGLPCGRPEVNEAYRLAFGQVCLGPGAPLGGYCGGVSNEILRGVAPKLEWACRNRPDLINSEGSATWNCSPGGLDILRLAAFVGGTQMLAAIDSAMGNTQPPPALCPNGLVDPGEDCRSCPQDAGACPPPPVTCAPPLSCREPCQPPVAPTCIQLIDRQTTCRCAGWTKVPQRKAWCAALCAWAKGLPTC